MKKRLDYNVLPDLVDSKDHVELDKLDKSAAAVVSVKAVERAASPKPVKRVVGVKAVEQVTKTKDAEPDDFLVPIDLDARLGEYDRVEPVGAVEPAALHEPVNDNPERWNEIVRFLTRDRFFSRNLFTLPFSLYHFLGRQSFRRLWIEGRAVQVQEDLSVWPRNIEYFLNGKDFFMNWIWPTALVGGFIFSDFIRYFAYPGWHFHNTILKVFLGTSPNQNEAFGSEMGSDLPNEFYSYWCGFFLLALLPPVFGLLNILRNRHLKSEISPFPVKWLETIGQVNNHEVHACWEQANNQFSNRNYRLFQLVEALSTTPENMALKNWVHPFTKRRSMLESVLFSLLWHDSAARTNDDHNILVNNLVITTNQHDAFAVHELPQNFLPHLNLILQHLDENDFEPEINTHKKMLFDHIKNIAMNEGSFAQLQALRALGSLVDKLRRLPGLRMSRQFNERDPLLGNAVPMGNLRRQLNPMGPENSLQRQMETIFNESLNILVTLSNTVVNKNEEHALAKLRLKLFASHELFTLGYYPHIDALQQNPTSKLKTAVIFAIFGMYELLKWSFLLATRLRYYEFLYWKLEGLYHYVVEKRQCEAIGRAYQYLSRTQENECQVCPDWEAVFDPTDPQSCLDGLLRSAKNPDELIAKLPVVIAQAKSLGIDLSGWNWLAWTDAQFQKLTQELARLESIKFINASRVDANLLHPHGTKIQSLASLINLTCVGTIDLTNQGIGDLSTELFGVFENNPCIEKVIFSGNQVANNDFRVFTDVVNRTKIKKGVFANNKITDEGIKYFSSRVQNSTLVEVDFSGNVIFQSGLDAIGELISGNPQLSEVVLSKMNLSGFDFTKVGEGLQNSNVRILKLVGCGLGDFEISTLTQYCQKVNTLDLSGNFQLTSQGALPIMENLSNSSVTEFILDGTMIDDEALDDIGFGLNATAIEKIDLSSNLFTGQAFVRFLSQAKSSKLCSIVAANNNFGFTDVQAIARALSEYSNLKSIELPSNNMSDEACTVLVNSLLGKKIQSINLSNNKCGINTAQALGRLLQEGSLSSLVISNNKFDSRSLKIIGEAMPRSALQNLVIAHNPQENDAGLKSIVRNLIEDFETRDLLFQENPPRDVLRWVNSDAKSQTKLKFFDASGTNSTKAVMNGLCVVLHKTDMKPENVRFYDNPNLSALVSCIRPQNNHSSIAQSRYGVFSNSGNPISARLPQLSSGNQNSQGLYPMLGLMVPFFGILFFAILLYRYLVPVQDADESDEENTFNELSKLN